LQIPIHASLLLVLNKDAFVLNYAIVPNDTRAFVQECLSAIWTTANSKITPSVVYTDNPKVDQNFIQQTFEQCFPDCPLPVEVLLDIYHAKMRVLKEMSKTHVDYRSAKSDLNTIFANLQVKGTYNTTDDLEKSFDDWVEKYSSVYNYADLDSKEKLNYLAKLSKQ